MSTRPGRRRNHSNGSPCNSRLVCLACELCPQMRWTAVVDVRTSAKPEGSWCNERRSRSFARRSLPEGPRGLILVSRCCATVINMSPSDFTIGEKSAGHRRIVRLTHIYVPAMFSSSPLTEGVFRRRSVGGAGRRRLQPGLVTPSQEARSPSGPDEGPAFGGWTRSDEGQRQCRLDHASGEKPSGPIKKYGDRVKNRRGGAPEGARAFAKARGRLRKGARF
jgi:hypothetical protein